MNEKWKKLTVKEESIKLSDEITINVTGLTFKELGKLAEFNDNQDFIGASGFILYNSIRKAVPVEELPNEELVNTIDTLSAETANLIITKVMELSGFKTSTKN